MSKPRVQIYGHRGARGLAPENSLPAYRAALAIGVDYLDMDVVMTADGELVVYHDLFLNPDFTSFPDGRAFAHHEIAIMSMTVADLQQLDIGVRQLGTPHASIFPDQVDVPGTRIPTLFEAIDHARRIAGPNIGFQIELKSDPLNPAYGGLPKEMAAAVDSVVRRCAVVDRTEVQAFDWLCLEELQRMNPSITTQYLTEFDSATTMSSPDPRVAGRWTAGNLLEGRSVPELIKTLGGKVWGAQDTEITPALLEHAHELGLKVVTWNWPDDPRNPQPADGRAGLVPSLIAMGVDGIIHDRPDVVRGLLAARGFPVAPAACSV